MFKIQFADYKSGGDRNYEAAKRIQQGDLYAKHTEEHDQRYLVDHRRGHQEGECYAQGNACLYKAKEQRYGAAGAERSYNTEAGRPQMSGKPAFFENYFSYFRRRQEGPYYGNREDYAGQQYEYFYRVKNKKVYCAARQRITAKAENPVCNPIG